jgi:hypothetical protein
MFGIKIAPDLGAGFRTDHQRKSPSSGNTWKRIDEAPNAPTDPATKPESELCARQNLVRRRVRYNLCRSTLEWCRVSDRKGSLIRHAFLHLPAPPPIFPLAIAMIEPSLRALLVAAVRATPLLPPRVFPAMWAAIAVSAITRGADEKYRETLWMAAHSLPQNCCVLIRRHALSQAGLDNGTCFVAG